MCFYVQFTSLFSKNNISLKNGPADYIFQAVLQIFVLHKYLFCFVLHKYYSLELESVKNVYKHVYRCYIRDLGDI